MMRLIKDEANEERKRGVKCLFLKSVPVVLLFITHRLSNFTHPPITSKRVTFPTQELEGKLRLIDL